MRDIKTQFTPINVKEEVEKVYQDSSVIHARNFDPSTTRVGKSDGIMKKIANYIQNKWKNHSTYKDGPYSEEDAFNACLKSVHAIVVKAAASKICYDDSIVSTIIDYYISKKWIEKS